MTPRQAFMQGLKEGPAVFFEPLVIMTKAFAGGVTQIAKTFEIHEQKQSQPSIDVDSASHHYHVERRKYDSRP